jgi:uncharacterized membrane protein
MFPISGQLKQEAKKTMGMSMPLWIKATFILVGLQLLFHVLRRNLGGMLGWYLMRISDFPDAATGYVAIENGFQFILRMEAMDAVAAISVTYGQVLWFLLINLLVFLLLAPMKMATMEEYWISHRGGTPQFKRILRWYIDPKLFFKSVVIGLILDLGCRLIAILLLMPSSILYMILYSGNWIGTSTEASIGGSVLALLALALLTGGMMLSFYLYTSLYPISYCLAARPDYSVRQIIKRGLDSIKGYRGGFFRFRLTFLPWYFMSFFTYGVIDLYVFPYLSFSAFQFLNAVARDRQEKDSKPTL